MRRPAAHAVLAFAVAACTLACTTGSKVECDCAEPGARVHVAPESAAAVVDVRLSGPACQGQKATCAQPAPLGCATYAIQAVAAGACTVDVVFVDTTFTASFAFQRGSDCCNALYPVPASAGDIDAPHAPPDAGAAG